MKTKLDTVTKARASALGLLARREHSLRELTMKLRDRGCPEPVIRETLAELVDEGMQSDDRFAEAFVRMKVHRGNGPIRIQAELLKRGISDKIIRESLQHYADWWKDLASEAYIKRFPDDTPDELAVLSERAKRSRFLQQRGFTPDQIRHALEQGAKPRYFDYTHID